AFAQRLAQQGNILVEIVFFHNRARPYLAEEIFLRNQPPSGLHEQAERFKSFELQRDFHAVAQQAVLRGIKVKGPKLIDRTTSCHSFLTKKSQKLNSNGRTPGNALMPNAANGG